MDDNKPTLGIYGIQDRIDTEYPGMVHDHAIALMNNGRVEKHLQLERITRRKRDNKLYRHIGEIARNEKLVDRDFDAIFVNNVVGKAFISSDGVVRFEAPLTSRLSKDVEKGYLWWFDRELDAYMLNHELAHIFSSLPFYGEFKENSLLVHFDGGASLSNFSAWMYRQNKIIPVEHHWEMKTMTSLFNANALTFGIINATMRDQNSVPGRLMGYAALGTYNEDIEMWLRQNKWFEDIWGKRSIFFEKAKSDFNINLKSFDQRSSFLQDVAATIQDTFMREILLKLDDIDSMTSCSNLYFTGGCALNIQSNSAIVDSGLFDEVFIPPCTEDSGLALGAAAFGEWRKGHKIQIHTPYLNNCGLDDSASEEVSPEVVAQVASLIAQGCVVGVCIGNGEVGPRALGNRSLLSLPTKALANKVSVVHKKREWYRPVAPVMLKKNTSYFTGKETINHLSRYMLLDFSILPEKQPEIAGVIHANGTARIQTIFERNDHHFLWDLLTILDERFGVKALVNTSFNHQGCPIVHTSDDALSEAKLINIDAVLINGTLTDLRDSGSENVG